MFILSIFSFFNFTSPRLFVSADEPGSEEPLGGGGGGGGDKPEGLENPEGLLSALQAEREKASSATKALKEQQKAVSALEKRLKQMESIDPDRYQQLVKEAEVRRERDLEKQQRYEEIKAEKQQRIDVLAQSNAELKQALEETKIHAAVKEAFYNAGGKRSAFSEEVPNDLSPFEFMYAGMRQRIKFDDTGKLVVTDPTGAIELAEDGTPKSLSEKMVELSRGNMGGIFEPQGTATGGGSTNTFSKNGKQVRVVTWEQAQSGQVSVDDIASGKVIVQ